MRHVLVNQHKLQNFLQQHVRLCSHHHGGPLPKPDSTQFDQPKLVIDTSTVSGLIPDPKQIEHDPDTGRQFTVSIYKKLNDITI